MLTDYFEPFTLLKSASCPDPCHTAAGSSSRM